MTPVSDFPYSIQTQEVFTHSRGTAWTALLFRGQEKIGFIEQDGSGGSDRINFYSPLEAAKWGKAVEEAFSGDEQTASYYLLTQEDLGARS